MATREAEACMYCELTPCGCNKAKPTKKVVKRLPAASVTSAPKVIPAAPAEAKPALSTVRAIRPAEDVEFETALTVLAEAGMLHPEEFITHRKSIKLTDEKIKLLVWKFRYWEARHNGRA